MSTRGREPVESKYTYDSGNQSYTLVRFTTPACNNDFPEDPAAYEKLAEAWSQNVEGFTQQAITGNPWNATNQAQQTAYYDPLSTPIPSGSGAVDVAWIAFPNRLVQYLGQDQQPPDPYGLPMATLNELADTGALAPYSIPDTLCPQPDWDGQRKTYGPYGPRGWLDEYCEFSVARDAGGKIVRIDFTCENPEYFQTLWRISPEKVAEVYQETLNYGAPPSQHVRVTVEDLQLVDPRTRQPVIDPQTGRAAYNPLNKWNSGTTAVRTGEVTARSGGAMHLTATPNTLQTELGLGAGATVQRQCGKTAPNLNPQALICCGQYGQNFRNSDPHIGQTINLAVSAGTNISLADPPGLYLQMPSFAQVELPPDPNLPAGATAADCWHIIRGFERLVDPITGAAFPGSFILHAAFQLPLSWIEAGVSFTVGDIKVAGAPLDWASQFQATLEVALFGRPIPPVVPAPPEDCVGSPPAAGTLTQPLQIMFQPLWSAYYNTKVSTPMDVTMRLASNSSIIPPTVPAGTASALLALTYAAPGSSLATPTVIFTLPDGTPDPTISATVATTPQTVNYAVPGNTYPSDSQLVELRVSISSGSPPGTRSVVILMPGQELSSSITPAPAFLVVGPAETSENS